MTVELPPLPRPFPNSYPYSYTADQMRAYARSAVNAALEQAEQGCHKISKEAWDDSDSDFSLYARGVSRGADKCADAIFAMKMKEQK